MARNDPDPYAETAALDDHRTGQGFTAEVDPELIEGLHTPKLYVVLRDAEEENHVLGTVEEPTAGKWRVEKT